MSATNSQIQWRTLVTCTALQPSMVVVPGVESEVQELIYLTRNHSSRIHTGVFPKWNRNSQQIF